MSDETYTEGCHCAYCHYRDMPQRRDPRWTECIARDHGTEPGGIQWLPEGVQPTRIVPKPEGYELREKRGAKAGNASTWTPADAVYFASKDIQNAQVSELVVYWWAKGPDGEEYLHFSNATSSKAEHAFLLQRALHALLSR